MELNNKLTTCKTCGKEVAKTARRCPHCGAQRPPIEINSPAAIISIIVIVIFCSLVFVFALTDWDSDESTPVVREQTASSGQVIENTVATTAAVPDILGDWEVTVESFETAEAISAGLLTEHRADEGNLFVIAHLAIKNTGKEAATFFPLVAIGDATSAKITYGEYEYSPSTLISMGNDDLHFETLNPLTSAKGIVVFQMPKDVAASGELKFVLSNGSQSLTYDIQ